MKTNYLKMFIVLIAAITYSIYRAQGQTTGSNAQVNTCVPAAGTAGTNYTFYGCGAGLSNLVGGSNVTFIGYNAGTANTTGINNTATGFQSLFSNTTGHCNTSNGLQSLFSNTTGNKNTAMGDSSAAGNTTGVQNSAFGYIAMSGITTGISNTGIGVAALNAIAGGNYNAALGVCALQRNAGGSCNTSVGAASMAYGTNSNSTAIGYQSLYNCSANNNTALGYWAGYANATTLTGSDNIFLGSNAGASSSQVLNVSNSMALGYNTYTTASNQFIYGNTSVAYHIFQAGNVGIGTTSPSDVLEVNGNISVTGGGVTGMSNINGRKTSGNLCINGNTTPSNGAAVQLFGNAGSYPGYLQFTTGINGHFEFYTTTAPNTWQNLMEILPNGNVGIGTTSPAATLDVHGPSGATLKIVDGYQANGYILTSNATGVASWTAPSTALSTAWLLTGNSTVSGNFMGSLSGSPDPDVIFQCSGIQAGLLNNYNSLIGTGGNTSWGVFALNPSNTGTFNTAIGYGTLTSNTSGYNNTAIGTDALMYNTTGYYNTAIGGAALQSSSSYYQTGYLNTALGGYTLASNYYGYWNTASGYGALQTNYGGNSNTATGVEALRSNYNGYENTAIGIDALFNNYNGNSNTAIGDDAGGNYNNNNENTFVGDCADAGSNGLIDATALGNDAIVTASHEVWFGNVNTVTIVNGAAPYGPSDGRFKINVIENVKGLEFIKKLRPVTYNMDTKAFDDFLIQNMPDSMKIKHKAGMDFTTSTAIVHSGFIAQEVDSAANAVGFTSSIVHRPANSTDPYALSYAEIVVPLVKAVQELSKKIDSLKSSDSLAAIKTGKQAAIIYGLLNHQQTTDSLLTVLQNCCTTGATHKAMQNNSSQGQFNSETTLQVELANNNQPILYQNEPNPFGGNTVIRYFIPADVTGNIYIVFYDMYGKELNKTEITTNGLGNINATTENLASGIYSYSLIVNDKIIDTKKMIKSK
jgi:trimeric autotransporter adhesin